VLGLPARYAVYPWIATVIQGYTASIEGVCHLRKVLRVHLPVPPLIEALL
jgi:hypothetical protein